MTHENRSRQRTLKRVALVACIGVTGAIRSAGAQASSTPGTPFETRESLTALADAAERAGRTAAARTIRARLVAGDFREGNRILLEITNAAGVTTADTLSVRANQTVGFKLTIPEVSLSGVLRSEVEAKLARHIAMTLRNPVVRATPLMRLGVIGAVGTPGYQNVSPAIPLAELITGAGGYTEQADPDKIIVRRGAETVWQSADVRIALTEGYSIDRFSLRDGDELQVPQKTPRNWMTTMQFVVGTASLLVLIFTQTR